MKVDKAFVLYANEAYYDVVSMAVKSINNVSDIPVIVYMMNSSKVCIWCNCDDTMEPK